MHHPWRAFRDLIDWTLRWSDDLPEDIQGETCFATKTVTLATGLTQAERRSTIAHETEHIVRGPVPAHAQAAEEQRVEEAAARRLIPLDALVEALLWSLDEWEIAEELWVDVSLVRARLSGLTDFEAQVLNARLDAAELTMPMAD